MQASPAPDEIKQFDASEFPVHFACELKDFEPTDWMERKQARRMDRFAQMIVAASRQAEADSGIDIAKEDDRIGASIATGIGGLGAFQDCYQTLMDRGPDRVNPFSITAIIPNMGAGWVSMELGTRGPLSSQCTACAASNMAIGEGADAIRLGRADAMICGGTEAGITRVGIAGFGAMRALSRRNDDPKRASRPFDAGRDGFVMGEAGGAVVLEELEHAKARGAKIYAELIGYGVSSDANHVTEPDPAGTNPARAMTMAFGDAGIDPSEIGYINAHGTSTPLGDTSETRVIKVAVGEENARKIPISSTKGATGHCLGAAGAVEAIFTILATERGILPPTINYEIEDPSCDLDYIPNESRQADITVGVSNSFGFGGHNACIVFRKLEAQLQQDDVAPDAAELADRSPPSDLAEPVRAMEREARLVLRKDTRLQRPEAAVSGALDQRREKRAADTQPTCPVGDVDALLADAAVDGAARVRNDRDPAGDLPVEFGYEPVLRQVPVVPVLPGRHLRLEGGVARRDALRKDRGDRGPVRGQQRANDHDVIQSRRDGRGERLRGRVDRRHGRAGVSKPRAAARGDARRSEDRRHDLSDRARPAHLSPSLAFR